MRHVQTFRSLLVRSPLVPLLALVVPGIARATCDAEWPTTLVELDEAIRRAEGAFVDMDPEGFSQHATTARWALGCLGQPLTPIHAGSYHRLEALDAFLHDNHPLAMQSFQAVRGVQPGYALPEELAPGRHPLRLDFEAAATYEDRRTFAIDAPASGWVVVDGVRGQEAPAARPFVFQWVAPDGVVGVTAYLPVGAPLPELPVAPPEPEPVPVVEPEPAPVVEPEPPSPEPGVAEADPPREARKRRWKVGLPIIAGGVALEAVGVVLYLQVAAAAEKHYPDLVGADHAEFWSSELAPRYYASLGLMSAGVVAIGVGTGVSFTFAPTGVTFTMHR